MTLCKENNVVRVAADAEEEECEPKCEQFNTEDDSSFWVFFFIIAGSGMVLVLALVWGMSCKSSRNSNEEPLLGDDDKYPAGYMAHPSQVSDDDEAYGTYRQKNHGRRNRMD